jgi:hypothetical protein
MTTPIPNMTITAPGQTGTTTVTLNGVDNFGGTINLTCALPAAMAEATCPAATANLGNNTTTTAQFTIATTAPHPLIASRASGRRLYGFGVLACVFLLVLPGSRRRKFPLALLVLGCVSAIVGCGGGGSSSPPPMDQGTPAGTYTVNVTATSMGITRTGTFTVTVQ